MDPEYVHTIIVGAGPGGLQMAYYLKRQRRDYVVLEASDGPGKFFETYPRHRTLISISKKHNFFPEKEFNMRHDWNSLLTEDHSLVMTDYSEDLFPSADALVQYLQDYHHKFQLDVRFCTRVVQIRRPEGYVAAEADPDAPVRFELELNNGTRMHCSAVLIGTGATGPYIPKDVPGIELAETYEEHSTDPRKYTNKTVLIIGGGNSGFETANHLAPHAGIIHLAERRPVRHAWDTHFVGDLRAVNNNFLDLYQLKSLHATLGDPPAKIERTDDGTFIVSFLEYAGHVDIAVGSVTLKREYDYVIACIGVRWVPDGLFSEECTPDTHTDGKYPCLTEGWEVKNVPHMFFIGGAMQAIDRKAASGFIHGFRYNVRSLSYLLNERYHNAELPHDHIDITLDALVTHVTDRLTIVSSLFQCFGVLCDVLFVPAAGGKAVLYKDLPRKHIVQSRPDILRREGHIFIITLQFGFPHYDGSRSANDFIQDSGTLDTRCGAFLHPVFEVYRDGEHLDEFHLFETLDLRFNTAHKKTQSLSTLNQRLLKDNFNYFLQLQPHATEEDIAPFRLLTHPDTPIEEKRRIFKQFLPVDEVWTEELLSKWKQVCATQKVEATKNVSCALHPLPISKWP